MKKYILLFMLLPFFISCSSDDNTDIQNDLVGTKWSCIEDSDPSDSDYIVYTLLFTSNSECTMSLRGHVGMEILFDEYYTYKIQDDNIIILTPKIDGNIIYKSTLNGNKMTLINTKTNKVYVILDKS